MRNWLRHPGALLMALSALLLFLFASAGARQGDANGFCVANMYQLAIAPLMYAQDYDEVLPAMQNESEFESLVFPYVKDHSVFVCPAIHKHYRVNATLSGRSLSEFEDLGAVRALWDSRPHADGVSTSGFLDGHVARGPDTGDPEAACIDNIYRILYNVVKYTQRYGHMPPMQTEPDFEQAINLYIQDSRDFVCPVRNMHYRVNAEVSDLPLSSFSDYSKVWVIYDTRLHPDGKSVVGFLDGHIELGGVNIIDPDVECVTQAKRLALGLQMYAQDYDEVLPPMHTEPELEAMINPYIRNSREFVCPSTHFHFRVNAALSGRPLTDFPKPATIECIHDSRPHPDGKSTFAYLDGHAVRKVP